MHSIRLAATLAALTLASFLPAAAQEATVMPPPPMRPGTPAPAFAARTLGGKIVSLRALRGKVVLLDYWATWCGPCRMATPTLRALHQKFHRQGLNVVGINMDDVSTAAQVAPFVKANHIPYAVTVPANANFVASRAYKVTGIPSQFLIDKKGIVRWSQSGFSYTEGQELTSLIQKLLAEH